MLNGRMMYETTSKEACLKAEPDPCSWVKEESVYQWYTEQEDGKTVIYANFQDKNPNEEQVEIIAKNACAPGETIHNLAGDVQPCEMYDAILHADALGKLALGK